MAEKTYAQLQAELDNLLQVLDNDDLDVDTAIATYEQATKLIAKLQAHLKTAEVRVKKIKA